MSTEKASRKGVGTKSYQASKELPPLHELNERFEVDAESPSGLRWTRAWLTSGRMRSTCPFPRKKNAQGYFQVRIRGLTFMAHRIVYALATGVDPAGHVVDHINGDQADNRPENLRLCSRLENARNRAQQASASGPAKGISRTSRGGRWAAAINCNGRQKWLGQTACLGVAIRRYDEAALRHQGEFSRTNFSRQEWDDFDAWWRDERIACAS